MENLPHLPRLCLEGNHTRHNVTVAVLAFLTIFIKVPRFPSCPGSHHLRSWPRPHRDMLFLPCKTFSVTQVLSLTRTRATRRYLPQVWWSLIMVSSHSISCLVVTLSSWDMTTRVKSLIFAQTYWTISMLYHWASWLSFLNLVSFYIVDELMVYLYHLKSKSLTG